MLLRQHDENSDRARVGSRFPRHDENPRHKERKSKTGLGEYQRGDTLI
jgi:hypothetical protein